MHRGSCLAAIWCLVSVISLASSPFSQDDAASLVQMVLQGRPHHAKSNPTAWAHKRNLEVSQTGNHSEHSTINTSATLAGAKPGPARVFFAVTGGKDSDWERVASTWGTDVTEPNRIIYYQGSAADREEHDLGFMSCNSSNISSVVREVTSAGGNLTFANINLLNTCSNAYPPVAKNLAVWDHMSRHTEYHWFVRCDSDTYVNVENVVRTLRGFDSATPYYMGCEGRGRPSEKAALGFSDAFRNYAQGGYCEIVSRGAAAALANCRKHELQSIQERDARYLHSDTELGRCLAMEGIQLTPIDRSNYVNLNDGTLTSKNESLTNTYLLATANSSQVLTVHPAKDAYQMAFLHETVRPSRGSADTVYMIGLATELEHGALRWQAECGNTPALCEVPNESDGPGIVRGYITCWMKMLATNSRHVFMLERDTVSEFWQGLMLPLLDSAGGHHNYSCDDANHIFPRNVTTTKVVSTPVVNGWTVRRETLPFLIKTLAEKLPQLEAAR